MNLIVINFIIHLLSLIITLALSGCIYYFARIRTSHEFLSFLFVVVVFINIINLFPLLMKDLVYLRWKKLEKKKEQRNKRVAEKFLAKVKAKNLEEMDSSIFSDVINETDYTSPHLLSNSEKLKESPKISSENFM